MDTSKEQPDNRSVGVRLVEQHCLGIGNWWTLRDDIDAAIKEERDRCRCSERKAIGINIYYEAEETRCDFCAIDGPPLR